MNSFLKTILWSVLLVAFAPGARAQVQAGIKTMRKAEKIFSEDVPVYEDPVKQPAPSGVKPAATPAASSRAPAPDSRPAGPTNWAVPGAVPVNYSKLELKIVSGPPQKRLATINNQTFLAGETLKVTVGTTRVNVTCQEIRERSVLVKIFGEAEPRELKLPAWKN
jgi:hypothetical protein